MANHGNISQMSIQLGLRQRSGANASMADENVSGQRAEPKRRGTTTNGRGSVRPRTSLLLSNRKSWESTVLEWVRPGAKPQVPKYCMSDFDVLQVTTDQAGRLPIDLRNLTNTKKRFEISSNIKSKKQHTQAKQHTFACWLAFLQWLKVQVQSDWDGTQNRHRSQSTLRLKTWRKAGTRHPEERVHRCRQENGERN